MDDLIFVCELSQQTKSQPPTLPRSGLKVCGSGGRGLAVAFMFNLNPSCIELELGSGFDNNLNLSYIELELGLICNGFHE